MKRYDMYVDEVVESPNGAWVMAEDAIDLQEENKRPRALADSRGQEIVLLSDRIDVISRLKDRLQSTYDAWITAGRPK